MDRSYGGLWTVDGGRNLFVFILVSATLLYTHTAPRAKYTSPNILPQLQIPHEMPGWTSRDAVKELNLNQPQYNFISNVFARIYQDQEGRSLLFLVLDAGNFHHPKVCFTSAGFTVSELPDTKLDVSGRALRAKTLYAKRGEEGFLVLYWIVIDKKQVDWTEQKFKQFWFSLFNRKRVGLMSRVDIPISTEQVDISGVLVKSFLGSLTPELPREQTSWLFGKFD
jgi:EpsI family protein